MNIYNFTIPHNWLGALDDTYIKVNVSVNDCPRNRTQKGGVVMNALGVCDTKDNLVFILAGLKGSTTIHESLEMQFQDITD